MEELKQQLSISYQDFRDGERAVILQVDDSDNQKIIGVHTAMSLSSLPNHLDDLSETGLRMRIFLLEEAMRHLVQGCEIRSLPDTNVVEK